MAKIIFDAETGTVLGNIYEVYIVDTDELDKELRERDPDFLNYWEDGGDALADEYHEAQTTAKIVGAKLENILAIAGQTN